MLPLCSWGRQSNVPGLPSTFPVITLQEVFYPSLAGTPTTELAANDEIILMEDSGSTEKEISATLDYLQAYSLSMPNAVPSLPLALSEVHVRNGVFYRDDDSSQPFHKQLLMALTQDTTIEGLNQRMLRVPGS